VILTSMRHLFEMSEDITYLNTAFISPQMIQVKEAIEAGNDRKSKPWLMKPDAFFSDSEELRALFAQLINADSDGVAIIPAVSYGMATIAKLLPWNNSDVLVLEDQFPSNYYPWVELVQNKGGEIITVSRPVDLNWTASIITTIESSPKLKLVALPHVHWTDGSKIDLEAIGRVCRDNGIYLVVDGTQSVGAIPFDVEKIKPDFLVVSTYKWMLGPYSIALLWAAPHLRDGTPLECSWLNRSGCENLANLTQYTPNLTQGARRYDMGQRANFALLPGTICALKQLLAWGVDNIHDTLKHHIQIIKQEAQGLGFVVPADSFNGGNFIGLKHPDGIPGHWGERLAKENIYVSMRGSSLRIAPYLFTEQHDLDKLFNHLEVLSRK
jgi:selenocysteine lyase/cysteine desulfurase